jgi:hypothetical protein
VDKDRFASLGECPDVSYHLLDPYRPEGVSFCVFRAEGTLAPVASTRCTVWQNETGCNIVLARKVTVIRHNMAMVTAYAGKGKESILSRA